MEIEHHHPGGRVAAVGDDDDVALVEQVRLTVPTTDDPTLPVWTFRMWTIGVVSCALLSFFNQFFAYRSEPIIISQITVQVRVRLVSVASRWIVPASSQPKTTARHVSASSEHLIDMCICRWRRCRWGTSWRVCCRTGSSRRSAGSGR
jgi:hypothetical protein